MCKLQGAQCATFTFSDPSPFPGMGVTIFLGSGRICALEFRTYLHSWVFFHSWVWGCVATAMEVDPCWLTMQLTKTQATTQTH